MANYGFKDNKCKVEVPTKAEFDMQTHVISGVITTPDNTRLGYYEIYLRKTGKTVYVKGEIGVDANVGEMSSTINITEDIPNWAKPTVNGYLLRQDQIHGITTATINSNRYLTPTTILQIELKKLVNDFTLYVNYKTSSFSTTSSAQNFEFNDCYLAV